MGEVVYMLSRNLTEAPIWERGKDRRPSEEVKKHVLAHPADLVSSWFKPKRIADLESKRSQLSPWRALTMVFMVVLIIPYLSISTVDPMLAA